MNKASPPPTTRKDKSKPVLKDSPVIAVDYEKYLHFFEHADMSEQDKIIFLQTLYDVLLNFVDLGFGVHPVQLAQKACGQVEKNPPKSALTASDEVKCNHSPIVDYFENAAASKAGATGQGVE